MDSKNPEFKAPWNQITNIPRIATPADKAVQTVNADTPYSWLGMDLRAEPVVLTVPVIDKKRYFTAQLIDQYTFNFDYIGSRATGNDGPSYIAEELADYIEAQKMSHVRGAPFHPQTQGKIERWHKTLKNRILLENYFLPGDLENQIEAFVEHYNHQRYHESLNNVTPADAYFGRANAIIKQRERIKRKTIEYRRLQHRRIAA